MSAGIAMAFIPPLASRCAPAAVTVPMPTVVWPSVMVWLYWMVRAVTPPMLTCTSNSSSKRSGRLKS